MLATGIRVPLVLTEFGTPLPPDQYPWYAWTGVGIHGEAAGANCSAWSAGYYKYSGQVGQISPPSDSDADVFNWLSNAHWTQYTSLKCDWSHHLYCFED